MEEYNRQRSQMEM